MGWTRGRHKKILVGTRNPLEPTGTHFLGSDPVPTGTHFLGSDSEPGTHWITPLIPTIPTYTPLSPHNLSPHWNLTPHWNPLFGFRLPKNGTRNPNFIPPGRQVFLGCVPWRSLTHINLVCFPPFGFPPFG